MTTKTTRPALLAYCRYVLELHGAHGYLIDQFFWAGVNERTAAYDGPTLAERGRLAVALVREVRRRVGEDFVISLRLSQWKQQDYAARLAHSPQEMAAWLTPLADAGVDNLSLLATPVLGAGICPKRPGPQLCRLG